MIEDRSLLSPELLHDPFPYLRALREEDPVHWSDHHHGWLLTRYADTAAAFLDLRLSSERLGSLLPASPSAEERAAFDLIYRLLGNWMVFQDPPDHARLRRLARAAFTGRMVTRLRPAIEAIVDERIRALQSAQTCDFIRVFAYPLPATVIAKLLGVPPEDLERFRGWSEDIKPLVFGASGAPSARRDRAPQGLRALERYFRDLLDRYQREPADNLLSALSRAEEEDDVLTADEVIATCVLLLFAGHETTTNLLASSCLYLDRNPEERVRLARDPSLAASAVEELLRYDGPSKMMVRIAREDVEIGGRTVHAGQRLMLVQSAANRDPEQFPDPDRLDLSREPNEHLGFGVGIHYCLGAPLARLEAEIALAALAERLPSLRVTAEDVRWQPTMLSRGLESLPVRVA
jgi:cytochrome P450